MFVISSRLSLLQNIQAACPLRPLRVQLPQRGSQKPLPLGATMITAASGGNRESLLGPRPARRTRSAVDAGCRNPGSGGDQREQTERASPLSCYSNQKGRTDTALLQTAGAPSGVLFCFGPRYSAVSSAGAASSSASAGSSSAGAAVSSPNSRRSYSSSSFSRRRR